MLLETEKETVCINKKVGENEKEAIVEGDVIVNDVKPDVLNIISADGIPCIYKKEVMDGKVRIDGSIITYIIYLADDENGSVRGLSTVLDFTQMIDIDKCNSGMISKENINIKNIECRILNSRKINVKATLNLNSKVFSNENIQIISKVGNLENIQTLSDDMTISSLIGEGCTKTLAKDTISVNMTDEIAEIMNVSIKVTNKDIKISYNKILAKADAEINIVYLTEDNKIKNVNSRIPIMGFVDIENISDNSICDVDYQIRNIIIKPNSGDMNSIYVEIEIEISCFAYETKNMNLIKDLYSVSSDLSFKIKKINTMSEKHNITELFDINEQVSFPEIENGELINVKTNPKILSTTLRNGKIIYEGEIILELLFENSLRNKY